MGDADTTSLRAKRAWAHWPWAVYLLAAGLGAALASWLLATPGVVSLAVHSNPPGANVFLDGVWRGASPVELAAVDMGQHHLRLTKHAYLPYVEVLSLDRDRMRLIELKPEPALVLRLETDPNHASVRVDGRPMGKTPLVLEGLEPGPLSLTIEKDGYESESAVVVVGPDTQVFSRTLKSKSGTLFASRMRQDPSNIDNYTELVHHHMVKADYDAACQVIRTGLTLIAQADTDPKLRVSGQVERFYQELVKIHRGSYNYGDASAVTGMQAKVQGMLAVVAKEYPACVRNYGAMANMARGGEAREKVIDLLLAAGKEHPDNVQLQGALAQQLVRWRRPKEAIAALRRVAELRPNDARARAMLAQALLAAQKQPEALKELRAAARLEPDEREKLRHLHKLAKQFVLMRKYDEAVKHWDQAIAIDPDREKACLTRLRAAYYCRQIKDFARARRLYQDVLAESKREQTRLMAQRGMSRVEAALRLEKGR